MTGGFLPFAEAEDLPAHGAALKARFDWKVPTETSEPGPRRPPHPGRAARQAPVRRAPARRPGAAEHQREPLPAARAAGRARSPSAVGRGRADLNRYPDRDAVALRAELAGTYRRATGSTAAQRVGGQRLQRGHPAAAADLRRARPHRARLRALVLDAPADRARHRHRLDLRRRATRTSRSTRERAGRGDRRAPARRRLHHARPTTRPAPRSPPDRDRRAMLRRRRAVAWWSSTRRTPSSAAAGTLLRAELLPGHPRLVVTRTMSKAFGARRAAARLPGRRPGRGRRRQLVRLPYHLSARHPGGRAGRAGAHRRRCSATSRQLKARARPAGRRAARARASRWPTPTPTSCCSAGSTTAHAVWQALLDRGVLVRDVGVPGWLRVTAGTPAENDAFLDAVRELKKEQYA